MKLRGNPLLRRLDRRAGIPLLMALGLVRRRRPRPPREAMRRLGILKSAAIGDTLLLSGVLADLRAQLPAAHIVLFTGNDNAGVVPLLGPVVDEHVVIAVNRPAEAIRAIRARRLDTLLDFGSWPRMDALLAASAGCFCAGFRTPGEHRHFAYDATVLHDGLVHETVHYRRLAEVLGVSAVTEPRITVPAERPADAPARYVVFHPWAGGYRAERREWPAAHWRELARWCAGEGFHVLVSGGPAEAAATESLVAAFRETGAGAESLAGRRTLPQLAHLLAHADAVVSVNTGVMHLAALVGAPTIGLHGPTAAARWGPVGPRTRAVVSPCPGAGYLDLGFEYDRHAHDCMAELPVERVVEAIKAGSRE